MKRFVLTVSLLLLAMHSLIGWISISYPEPDGSQTLRLWKAGYIEAGLPNWELPPILDKSFLLWFPFYVSSDILGLGRSLILPLLLSIICWTAFALFFREIVLFCLRKIRTPNQTPEPTAPSGRGSS